MELKRCNHCGRDLPGHSFYRDKKRADGLTAYCRDYYAEYYAANRERQKATSRKSNIKRRYGLSLEEYDAILALGCAICGERATTRLVLDHCHASGKVRSCLCNNCNVVLGSAKDDPDTLRAAADYLERHGVT